MEVGAYSLQTEGAPSCAIARLRFALPKVDSSGLAFMINSRAASMDGACSTPCKRSSRGRMLRLSVAPSLVHWLSVTPSLLLWLSVTQAVVVDGGEWLVLESEMKSFSRQEV